MRLASLLFFAASLFAQQIDWVAQIRNKPMADPRQFDFPAQTPGGSLIVGATNVTMRPVPLGVNGNDVSHYLYVYGGTGTAEPCLITGGAGRAGQTSGVIQLTCTHTHSGSWHVSSAANGVQEAIVSLPSGGTLYLNNNAGQVYVHGPIVFPANVRMAMNSDVDTWPIWRSTEYKTGDIIRIPQGAFVSLHGLTIWNDLDGGALDGSTAIHAIGCGGFAIENVAVVSGSIGLDLDGCGVIANNFSYGNVGNLNVYGFQAGVYIHTDQHTCGGGGTDLCFPPSNVQFTGGGIFQRLSGTAMFISAVDGLQVDNMLFGGASVHMYFATGAGTYISNVYVTNSFFDQVAGNNITIVSDPASIVTTAMFFTGNHIAAYDPIAVPNQTNCVDIGFSNPLYNASQISFTGGNVNFCGWVGIGIGPSIGTGGFSSHNYVTVTGVQVAYVNQRNLANFGGIQLADGVSGVTVSGGLIGNAYGNPYTKVYYGVASAGNISNVSVTGVNMLDTTNGCVSVAGSMTDVTIVGNTCPNGGSNSFGGVQTRVVQASNTGISNILATVASATTMALPSNMDNGQTISVSGTTGVTTVSGFRNGQFGSMLTPDGAVAFTAGGSIGKSFTTVQNQLVNWSVAGGKIYLH